jgi:hypothetical protein
MRLRILVPVLGLILGLPFAYGGPVTFLQLNESATAGDNNTVGGSSASFNSGMLMQFSLLGPMFIQTIGGVGFANASGRVAAGQIHGVVSAEGKHDGSLGSQGNPIEGSGVSDFSGEWVDTLTAVGPIGTSVNIRLTNSLHSVVSLSVPSGTFFSRADAFSGLRVLQGSNPVDLNLDNPDSNPILLRVISGDFVVPVGSSFIIEQTLNLHASALGSSLNQDVMAIADASNTSNVFIDVLTPGATLTSASGAQYASASSVPEPASCLLTGCGLLACAFFSRSRHRKMT